MCLQGSVGCLFEPLFGQSLLSVYSATRAKPAVLIGGRHLFACVSPPADQHAAPPTGSLPLPPELDKLYSPKSRQRRSLQRIAVLADTQVPVLINGETGSGKEFLARAIHLSGSRADAPFIAVNCAAIPENLIESELYGYAPGSFSGAERKGKIGLIQAADGGTLFLDEIGDMPLYLQSRLLRVLSEREVLPVGSTRAVKVDGGYKIKGSKLWTSGAHSADYAILFCKMAQEGQEEIDRHAGGTQFLLDLKAPGIDIRPVINLLGEHHFNEIFLTDVFIPDNRLLGKEGNGWNQVTGELAFERSAPDRFLVLFQMLREMVRMAGPTPDKATAAALGKLGKVRRRYATIPCPDFGQRRVLDLLAHRVANNAGDLALGRVELRGRQLVQIVEELA